MLQNSNSLEEVIQNTKNNIDIYIHQKKYVEAEKLIMEMLSYNPFDHEMLCALSVVKFYQNHLTAAQFLIEKAIKEYPQESHYWYMLGLYLQEMQQIYHAEIAYKKAVELNPTNIRALVSLGVLYHNMQDFEQSRTFFTAASQINPDDQVANYFTKVLNGEKVDCAPKEYIKNLFDFYSSHFDDHLTKVLGYKIPDLIAEIFMNLPFPANLMEVKILDLGCGTGLVAEKIMRLNNKKLPLSFTGIDLSARMLEVARSRKVYSKLKEQSIEDFYAVNKKAFDCIIAADVFVYIGNLESIFKGTYTALKDGGHFIFSVETSDNDQYFPLTSIVGHDSTIDENIEIKGLYKLVQSSARYQHSESYIRSLAIKFGFEIKNIDKQIIRKERNSDIVGLLVHLVK